MQHAKTPAAKATTATTHSNWSIPALWVFLGAYVVFAAVTVAVYLLPSYGLVKSRALAEASV